MKIIKTAQFSGLPSHGHKGHHAHEDQDSLGIPTEIDFALPGDESEGTAHGHDNPIGDVDVPDHDLMDDAFSGEDLGDHDPSLTMDDQGHMDLDLGGPLEPGVGPEIPDQMLGDDGMLDIDMHIDPHPGANQLPLDVEVDGHELPIDDLVPTEDHNDPALGLDEIDYEDDGQGHDHHDDTQLSNHKKVDDVVGTGEGDHESAGHADHEDSDAGLDGLLVIDDGLGGNPHGM